MKNCFVFLGVFLSLCNVAFARPTVVMMSGGGDTENAEQIALQECLIYSADKSNKCKIISTKAGPDSGNTAFIIKAVNSGKEDFDARVTYFESEKAFLYPCTNGTETANTRAMVDCSRNCDYDCKIVQSVIVDLKDKAPLNVGDFGWLAKSKLKQCFHVTKTACVK